MATEESGFDLELVHQAFSRCEQSDGTILIDEYVAGYAELSK